MTQRNLVGKLAVVTGGSRGIGYHIAKALHEAGAQIVITARHERALQEAVGKIGEHCRPLVCDQSDPVQIQEMANQVLQQLGMPDILVNNAGVYSSDKVMDMSLEKWNHILDTNLTGVFLTTKAFLPSMIAKDRGDIFMIGSMSGKKGDPGTSAYNASKFGLQGFSQALAYEVRKHNIRVMVLNPSSVDTSETPGAESGPGLYLHARDLADTVVHLATLPGRILIRDMDIWGTNP